MDFLHSLYDIVSGLGSFLLIPVFFFLMGLVTHAGFQRSGQCALAMLGSTVAIQLLINTLSGRLTTLVSAMVDNYSLSTGAQNLPWQTAAEMTLNSDILYWVLPGAVLLNLLMLATRVTRVLNMDLWSLWQAAFAGVLVQQLTGEMWYGLAAALLMVILQMIGGFWFDRWETSWLWYLTIPFYYTTIVPYLKKHIKYFRRGRDKDNNK